jgi:hypothetical protein
MLSVLLVTAVQFAIVTVVGMAVLALVPSQRARGLLPAVPLLGVAYLVTSLSLASFLLPVRVAVWITVPAILIAATVVSVRRKGVRIPAPREWWSFAAVSAVGAGAAIIAIMPSIYSRSALVVQPTASNDAFFYVQVARWLLDHPLSQLPAIGFSPASGADAPAFGPAYDSLNQGLRVGQGLVRAATSALTGIDPVYGFSPVLGVWVLLIPAGAWLLGRAVAMPAAGRILLGAVVASSYSLTMQVLNQNGDSVLGVSLLLAAIGLIASAMNNEDDRPPYWLAALALTALAGTYTEFGPFAGAAVLGILLFRPRKSYVSALRALGIVVAIALAIGPVIWFRAVKSLFFVGGLATGGGSAVTSVSDLAVAFLGPYAVIWNGSDSANYGFVATASVVVLVLAVVAGVVLACADAKTRGFAVGVIAGAVIAVVVILRSVDYIGDRAVDMLTPLLLAAAVMGWWTVPLRLQLRRSTGNRRRILAGAVAVAACVAIITVGVAASVRTVNGLAPYRSVSPAYAEAVGCAISYAGPGGSKVTVATSTLFEQLWLSDSLAEDADAAYPNLRGDLGYRANLSLTSFWDGELDPYLLIGPGAFVADTQASELCSFGQFRVLDMQHNAVVAVPMVRDQDWLWFTDVDGSIRSSEDAPVLILTERPSLEGVSLVVSGVAAGTTVSVFQAGELVGEADADVSGSAALSLGRATVTGPGAEVTISTDSAEPGFTLQRIEVR